MKTIHFKNFYKALSSEKDRKLFKERFFIETKLSYPTFYNYQSCTNDVIPFLCAEKIMMIARELFPDLAHILNGFHYAGEDPE